MKIHTISENTKKSIKNKIRRLFLGSVKEVNIDCISPAKIVSYLEEMGIEVDTDTLDTNGWQYDYWLNFDYLDECYTIFGSGYYGNMKISKDK